MEAPFLDMKKASKSVLKSFLIFDNQALNKQKIKTYSTTHDLVLDLGQQPRSNNRSHGNNEPKPILTSRSILSMECKSNHECRMAGQETRQARQEPALGDQQNISDRSQDKGAHHCLCVGRVNDSSGSRGGGGGDSGRDVKDDMLQFCSIGRRNFQDSTRCSNSLWDISNRGEVQDGCGRRRDVVREVGKGGDHESQRGERFEDPAAEGGVCGLGEEKAGESDGCDLDTEV